MPLLTITQAPPGVCPDCGGEHPREEPHDPDSRRWQCTFLGSHGRWPGAADAAAHCHPEIQRLFERSMRLRGMWWDPPVPEWEELP